MGNANLEPEEIETVELSFDYQPSSRLRAVLSLFNYRIEELIDFIGIGGGVFRSDNYGIQEGRGFEFELDWKPVKTFRLKSNYAFQRSRNKTLHALTWETPEQQLYINPHWYFMPDWSLDGQLSWIADRHRYPDDPRPEIDDYTKVDINLRRKNIFKRLDLTVGVKNLFNHNVREPSNYDSSAGAKGAHIPNDYPMDGRSFWGELRYSF